MSMNRIALYQIETLIWIDRLGTFAAAAQRLNTTQPTISARIRELEMHLGVKLFRREGRTMTLTPVGRRLVREFGAIWGDLQGSLLACTGFSEAAGVVRIGAGEIAAASCLPAFVAELKQAMPGVSLEIEIDLTATLLLQLVNGRTDIAFAAGAVAHPALRTCSIGTVELLWLASPQVADALNAGVGEPSAVWSLSGQSPLYHAMREAIRIADVPLSSINLSNNVRSMIDIVSAGCGIGLFPRSMVRQSLDTGTLVPVSHMPTPAPVTFHAAIRAAEIDPIVLETFRRSADLMVQ